MMSELNYFYDEYDEKVYLKEEVDSKFAEIREIVEEEFEKVEEIHYTSALEQLLFNRLNKIKSILEDCDE